MRLWGKAGWIGNQKGNVFAMIFAGVAMVGVMGVATMNLVVGPATTVTKVTNQNMAQNDLLMNAKVVVMNAATRPNGGDEDEDGYIEPVPFVPTSDPTCAITLPGEGGCLPMDIGAIQTDPWGTQYAYCVWDHGSVTGSENRIAGEDSTSGAVIAIISAGPSRQFETPCLPYDGDPETNDIGINPDGLGDDLVQIYTYAGAVSGSGGLWELKQGEPTTAVTAKDVEVDGAFRMGFAGEDPGQVGLASCTDMNHIGRMRFNPLDKAIEVCVFNGNYGWETLAGESTGGGQVGTLTQKAGLDGRIFPDAIICINNNIPRVLWFAADNTASSRVVYRFTFSSGDVISIHYSSATGLYLDYSSTSTRTVADVADAADPCRTSVQAVTLAGRSYNLADGSAGHLTMVPGWPDAIVCKPSSGTWDDIEWILYRMFGRDLISNHAYRSLGTSNTSPRYIRLDMYSDGSFHRLLEIITGSSPATIDGDCAGKTISQLYADGQAFNFVGGSSGGSSAEGVDATGMIVAFASDTCPAGWSEYTPARGRFLRGIDPSGTIDSGGTRAAGHVQNDALQNITGTVGARHTGGSSSTIGLWAQPTGVFGVTGSSGSGIATDVFSGSGSLRTLTFDASASPGARTSNETRPKNVAVTFCRFDGEGVLLGGGAGGEGDNLGDHTATQNLDLSVNKLVGEGGTDGIYINSDGNVGIGTSAPIGGLTVKRTVALGEPGQIVIDRPAGTFGFIDYRSDGVRRWHMGITQQPETGNESGSNFYINRADDDGNWIDTPFVIARNTGNVGIGTGNPAGPLHVELNASGTGSIIVTDSTAPGGALRMGEGTSRANSFFPTIQGLPAGGNSFYTGFFSSITPANDSGSSPVMVFTSRQVPSAAITTRRAFQWRNNATNLMTIDANGNVGIGTASPQARLHVNSNGVSFNPPALTYSHGQILLGNIATTNYSANGIAFTNQSGGTGWRYVAANSDSLFFGSSSTGVLGHFTNAGNFYVAGNGYAPNWVNTSDARLKTDVKSVSYGLDTIVRLNAVTFDWIDEELRAENGRQIGFIAQEVEAVVPELVKTDDDEIRTKSLAYGQLTAVLTKAVQELKALLDDLVGQVAELSRHLTALAMSDKSQNERIAELEAQNDRLRADLEAANGNFRRELDELRAMIAE